MPAFVADMSSPGVLIVDDDLMQARIISSVCATLGLRATVATSYDAAADQLNAGSFDCVTIDLSLGDRDGIELLRLIAELDQVPRVIVISGCEQRILNATVRMAQAAGICDAISIRKPIELPLLRQLLTSRRIDCRSRQPAPARKQLDITAADLQRAVQRGEIYPAFQPKVLLSTGRVVGCEALARWDSAEFGSVGPDRFIPLAEASGDIKAITLGLLHGSLEHTRLLRSRDPGFVMAVNLSATLLSDPLIPEEVERLLEQAGVPAKSLMIEVTETTAMADIAQALDILLRLRIKGVGVSMDDFGTGYSSLSALARMPFCELKIDRLFVKSCLVDADMWKVVSSSIAIAHAYHMKVVAEGVEDDKTWRALQAAGCDIGQGYVFSRALPGPMFADWYDKWAESLSAHPVAERLAAQA